MKINQAFEIITNDPIHLPMRWGRQVPLNPRRFGSSLALWLDAKDVSTMLAGDGSVITDGGAVALWADKSGNSGVNCLVLPGVAANYASVPDAAALDITGDIELQAMFSKNTAAGLSANVQVLVAKWNAATANRSYGLFLDATTGLPTLGISDDGSGVGKTIASSANITFPFNGWLKATWLASDGTVQFFTSTNGTSWTQLGTDVTLNVGSIHSGSALVEMGTFSSGAAAGFNGNIFRAIIKDGIDGTTVLDIDFSQSTKKLANADTFVCATGQTVTLNSSGVTGARIAGERDLYQGTAANRPVYLGYSGTKYGYLNGVAGNYFSTPNSAAVSVTGANELRCSFVPPTMTPSGNVGLIAKWSSTGNQRSFGCSFTTTSALVYLRAADGATTETATSSATLASVGFAENQLCYIKVTHDTATGAVKFYYSADGSSYTQLGTDKSVTAGANYDGTGIVTVGLLDPSPSQLFAGRIYRAQIYNGIDGTLVFDFNPATYTSGTTFADSSSNAATITLNGGATIVTRSGLYFDGSNDYLKTAAFSYAQPESVYFVGSQVAWVDGDTLYDGSSATSMRLLQATTTPRLKVNAGSSSVGDTDTLALNTAGVLFGRFDGASTGLRLNRNAIATGSGGTSAANGLTLMALADGSARFTNGTVSEIILRSAADATATQDRIALYAGRRWGIAV